MPLARKYITNRAVVPMGSGVQLPMSAIYHQTYTDVSTADSDGIVAGLAGPNATTLTLVPGAGLNGALVGGLAAVLSTARNVVITVTHATSVVALSGTIFGKDVHGRSITEDWSVTAGTASKVFTGKKAFKLVTSITVTAATDASADTVNIGEGVVLGVDVKVSVPKAIIEMLNGTIITTGTLVIASTAATDDPRGTYTPVSAPNGTNDYDIWVMSDDPEWSASPLG